MTRDEIITLVNNVFVEQFELEPSELLPEKHLFEDLGLDSLDIVDMLVELHKTFGIALRQNEEVRSVRTLNDIYDFLERYAAEHPDQIRESGL
ncbi:MAG: acyl carrier protein [Lentisphaeria bacterium]|nr:acyl carrier protein [Lentisphaeria bacterium]